MELFGFEIKRRKTQEDLPSFTASETDDGAVMVGSGGITGQYVDLEGSAKSEGELVTRYRNMAQHPECDLAIDDIVNEVIVLNETGNIVECNLDALDQPDSIKKRIREEFDNVVELMDFNNLGYDLFRRWYVDGRMYFHVIIDEKNPRQGIQELRYIDPRKIRKVKKERKKRDPKSGATLKLAPEEFFMYNDKAFKKGYAGANAVGDSGVRIAKDSVVHCTSGLVDASSRLILGHLHKAIKPMNQLRILEDAAVIYRISRAPERRIFYIDVGNLPKMKAEQYLRDMMVKHKNRLVYDAASGEVRDDRKFMTMLEDFWLPRREGGRGTEITSLPGGQNLGEMDDVLYFQKNLYKALNVPVSRLDPETGFSLGRASEISRDELKFAKFVDRLRLRFSMVFHKCLERQLILKGVITSEDWIDFKSNIKYDFAQDNHFAELREAEVLRERMSTLNDVENYVGKYYSQEWIRKNILQQSDDDIEEINKQIEEEGLNDEEIDQDQQPSQNDEQ
jgi:hypothetical protein